LHTGLPVKHSHLFSPPQLDGEHLPTCLKKESLHFTEAFGSAEQMLPDPKLPSASQAHEPIVLRADEMRDRCNLLTYRLMWEGSFRSYGLHGKAANTVWNTLRPCSRSLVKTRSARTAVRERPSMSRVTSWKGRSKMSVGEAASRVGEQVDHAGQGQDERARPRPPCLLRGLDSAWSVGSNPHRQRGNAVAGCGRRWSRPGPAGRCGRGATREPLGRLRWRRGTPHSRRTSQR
jgi:hypothetical protein